MPAAERKIRRSDILSQDDYNSKRPELRALSIAQKKLRRVEVGPYATFYFENYQSMWLQVQEMLRIEKGGEDQIAGELDAYNPLIPQGRELIATMMLEIEDTHRRDRELRNLGNIEENVFLELGAERITATPTDYDDRTTADGKTSSVHWLRFGFTSKQIALFRDNKERALLGICHPNYGHMAVIGDQTRITLANDFA